MVCIQHDLQKQNYQKNHRKKYSKEIFGDNKTYKVIFEVAPETNEEVSLPAIFLTTRTISSTTNLAPHLTKTKTKK
jgi:hypothetical protein